MWPPHNKAENQEDPGRRRQHQRVERSPSRRTAEGEMQTEAAHALVQAR